MKFIFKEEVVDTYGGDYTWRDVWYEDGKFYEEYYGAKLISAEEITDEEEIRELKSYLVNKTKPQSNE